MILSFDQTNQEIEQVTKYINNFVKFTLGELNEGLYRHTISLLLDINNLYKEIHFVSFDYYPESFESYILQKP